MLLPDISNQEIEYIGDDLLQIRRPMSHLMNYNEFIQSILSAVSTKSTEWFGQFCSIDNLNAAISTKDTMDILICSPVKIHSWIGTENNSIDISDIIEKKSKITDIFVEICSVQFYETNITFELKLVSVCFHKMKDAFIDLCSTEMDSKHYERDIPIPYPSELDSMNSLISKKLHEKRLQISKLTAIEEFIKNNYTEKIQNISMNRKKIVDEITSLQDNLEKNL